MLSEYVVGTVGKVPGENGVFPVCRVQLLLSFDVVLSVLVVVQGILEGKYGTFIYILFFCVQAAVGIDTFKSNGALLSSVSYLIN